MRVDSLRERTSKWSASVEAPGPGERMQDADQQQRLHRALAVEVPAQDGADDPQGGPEGKDDQRSQQTELHWAARSGPRPATVGLPVRVNQSEHEDLRVEVPSRRET